MVNGEKALSADSRITFHRSPFTVHFLWRLISIKNNGTPTSAVSAPTGS
jgi:hypothetical protein